jgi:hypothetical protein
MTVKQYLTLALVASVGWLSSAVAGILLGG